MPFQLRHLMLTVFVIIVHASVASELEMISARDLVFYCDSGWFPFIGCPGSGRDNERSPGLWLATLAGCWALIGHCEGQYWLLGPHAMDTVSRLCLTHYGKQSACLNLYLTLSNVSQSICIIGFRMDLFLHVFLKKHTLTIP